MTIYIIENKTFSSGIKAIFLQSTYIYLLVYIPCVLEGSKNNRIECLVKLTLRD